MDFSFVLSLATAEFLDLVSKYSLGEAFDGFNETCFGLQFKDFFFSHAVH